MKDFKGLVKISDVQDAFNEVINSMNDIIDTYNASARVLDINYTKGSSELGASGYTLSVGGLKRIIEIYQGCAIGCKPFKIDNNHCKVTSGYVFADGTVYRTYEQDMTGSGTVLYYDVDNKRYSFGAGATSSTQSVPIPDIRNNNSWGTIYATENSSYAWQVPSLIQNNQSTQMPYIGWIAQSKVGGYNKEWKWVWNFPTQISCDIECTFLDAFNITDVNPFYIEAIGGSLSGSKWTRDENSLLHYSGKLNNANGLQIRGTFYKRSAYYEPFLGISGLKTSNVTGTVITGGDSSAGRLIKICDLNWNADSKQLATINKTMSESSSRSITIQAQNLPFNSNNGYNGSGDFVWATDNPTGGDGTVNIFGREISRAVKTSGSTMRLFTIPTYFYIPKGLGNPITSKLSNTYKAKYNG